MLRLITGVLLISSAALLGCGSESGGGGGGGGDGGAGGTMMLEPGPTCTAFCAHIVGDCAAIDSDEASCGQGCEANLLEERAKSEDCGDAVEAVFECATDLGCQGVEDWLNREPLDAYPCRSAVQNVDLTCP